MFKPYDQQKRTLDKILEIRDRETKFKKLQAFIDAETKASDKTTGSEQSDYQPAPKLKSRQVERAKKAMLEFERPELDNLPTLSFLSSEDALELDVFDGLKITPPSPTKK